MRIHAGLGHNTHMKKLGKICIIDDDEAVRESLRMLLFVSGYESVLFESADHFLQEVDKCDAETLVLDLRMPGTDGLELQEILTDRGFEVPIIFITGHGDIPLAVSAIQRGAVDFLTKPFEEGELLSRIAKSVALHRERQKTRDRNDAVQRTLSSLTPRETEVMELIVSGMSNKQVAGHLGISPRTVEIHRAHVMEKTGADSVAALVRLQTGSD
jgi:two-component system response regulator TtrR